MRNTRLILIAILTLSFLAACAKKEAESTATTTTEPTAVSREGEVLPPSEPTEAVLAETESAETGAVQTTATAPETTSAATPPPLLPRRGEVTSVVEHEEKPSDPATLSQRITVADANEIIRAGNGVLVDVRSVDAYNNQHIPGSLSIPLPEVANRARELPQDKWIITYCTCPAEETSGAAATTLNNMGFERVAALLGGMQGWRAAGLPTEFGQQ